MIILIVAGLFFLALFVLCCFIPLKTSKTLIMSTIVMAMLLLTIVDELIIPKYPLQSIKTANHFEIKTLPTHLMLNVSSDMYKNSPARTLLKEEKTLLTYLLQKQAQKENFLTYINNIDSSRFRAIFKQFQAQTKAPAVYVDYKLHNYIFSDLQAALTEGKGFYNKYKNRIVYFIVNNVKTFEDITALQNIFLVYNVSYILQNIPSTLLEMSSLGKWTYRYQFEGNYISQVLENHPPRLVQLCNKYRTIDYPFYVMSQSEPLSELCTKLPTNSVTQCIRDYLKTPDDRVPYSKVRKCFEGNQYKNIEGVIVDNGMVGLVKDYYYAGRVNKNLFLFDNSNEETL